MTFAPAPAVLGADRIQLVDHRLMIGGVLPGVARHVAAVVNGEVAVHAGIPIAVRQRKDPHVGVLRLHPVLSLATFRGSGVSP